MFFLLLEELQLLCLCNGNTSVLLCKQKERKDEKRTISHIFVCCFHLVANLEKRNLGLYFSEVIINKWKQTLGFLEVVLILTSSCLDGSELGLEVRFSLWKTLNINASRGKGWCLLCHTLCFCLIQAAVPRGAGQRWGQEHKPMSAEPNPSPCCRQQWWDPAEYGLCWLHELAQIHQVTFSHLCFWAYNVFSLFHFSRGLYQHTGPIPHNL